mmetsp:Transcript_27048/g.63242  ORF Transcript_27048/g.63242 Transcript_27048/m.63242 type:complete len:785 (+) Transcript_27048:897-3251(+)
MQTMAATNAPSDDGSGGGGVRGEVGSVGSEGMAVYGVVGLQAVVVHPEIPSGDGGGNGDGSGGSGGRSVDPLLRLPKSIAKKLHEFMESADPGQRLKFKPGELTPAERRDVHMFGEHNGLESRSEGPKSARVLTLTKESVRAAEARAAQKAAVAAHGGGELRVVKNAGELEDDDETYARRKVAAGQASSTATAEAASRGELTSRVVIYDADEINGILDGSLSAEMGEAEDDGGAEHSELQGFHGRVVGGDAMIRWAARAHAHHAADGLQALLEDGCDSDGSAGVVVIMRGLPGSGKSTLARNIRQRCDAGAADDDECVVVGGERVMIVSADEYFEQGGGLLSKKQRKGMSEAEVYAECFDASKLTQAHEYCRTRFTEAVGDGCGVVIVDNTNVSRREYEWYLKRAVEANMRHVVVEVFDPNPKPAGGGGRGDGGISVHNVPDAAIGRMRGRFEPDSDAVRLKPWSRSVDNVDSGGAASCTNTLGTACTASRGTSTSTSTGTTTVGKRVTKPLGSSGNGALSRWLSAHHSVHYVKTKKKSHLGMACEGSSHHFLWVPPKLMLDFFEVMVHDTTPHWLCEVATEPAFRLFFDVDMPVGNTPSINGSLIERIIQALLVVLAQHGGGGGDGAEGEDEAHDQAHRIIVVGCAGGDASDGVAHGAGYHIHCPGVVVNEHGALSIRSALVGAMVAASGEGEGEGGGSGSGEGKGGSVAYGEVIDESVYVHKTLRMLGSRKATKGHDKGRLYQLVAAYDGHGARDRAREQLYASEPVRLLADCSIRADTPTF